MSEVVDSDELLRRIQRARAFAAQEVHTWSQQGDAVREVAYEVVLRVLDEIVAPGRHATK
ncbi:hypothetical protein [Streptomyces prunicolor]|jgi:hypothetical protein|uniref:Uncharacterized protein n=1 Tax=Streptomyces prunicolor TaxID=67348 RepID=A0ABU4FCK6_9ACTN|nr:hypothetical protein [Streptomyces prunicolor]MCX5243062.1 hypothetical protein [Streptomyces prunicolor]MDV7218328.1 hypothetical protein [Streptomyces prunicolor]